MLEFFEHTPERFFADWFVLNYCPLVFLEASGRNFTPDKLPTAESGPLYAACDRALARIAQILEPEMVIGVGAFAEARAASSAATTLARTNGTGTNASAS